MIGGKMVLVGRGKRGEPYDFGNVLQFDGANDFIISGNVPAENIYSAFTKFIFKNTGTTQVIFRHGTVPVLNEIRVSGTNQLQSFTGASIESFNFYFVDGEEYSLTSTYNRLTGEYKIHINGQEFTDTKPTSSSSSLPLWIGVNSTNNNAFSSMKMQVFVYANAEINYNNAVLGVFNSNDLLIYYPLNEIEGTVAEDISGNGNNGTLTNFIVGECPYDGEGNTCPWKPFNS
jgi:hypothetical protein